MQQDPVSACCEKRSVAAVREARKFHDLVFRGREIGLHDLPEVRVNERDTATLPSGDADRHEKRFGQGRGPVVMEALETSIPSSRAERVWYS